MVEMAPQEVAGHYLRGFAGDSFNTAVYLARAGLYTRYLTRLGDDPGSRQIIRLMEAERIDTSLIELDPGRAAGLYLIDNDVDGERHFSYYRDHSPARQTFASSVNLLTDVFYFTGISLAVMRSGLDHLCQLLDTLHSAGTTIVFDPNYRPGLWQDLAQAQQGYRAVLPFCHTLLPTLDDDRLLWGVDCESDSIGFYRQQGADEIIVKGDNLICHSWNMSGESHRASERVAAIDTTGAGDAFNAGFLASRLEGKALATSLEAGQTLAAQVVQHRGAILPRSNNQL